MISLISIGVPIVLVQNVVYAMPVAACNGFCEEEDVSVLEVAMFFDAAAPSWIPLPGAIGDQGEFFSAAPFIKCVHADGRTVILKRGLNRV